MKRALFWTLFAVTMAIYAIMIGWSLPHISAAAKGLAPFDLRPGGYSFEEAQAFLDALGPDGTAFYQEVQHRLDLFFPALIALTLVWAIAGLSPRVLGRWRWLIGAMALPVAAFDYLENAAVSAMLNVGPAGLTRELVAAASNWTVAKSLFSTIAMTAVLGLLIRRLVPWITARLRRRTTV